MVTTYLIDSNILVYAANKNSPYQRFALEVMNKVIIGKMNACLSYQTLYEFYAIITDPKRVESPISPKKAQETIELYMVASNIKKIFPQKTNLQNTLSLLKKYKVSKQTIFDLVLVATMMDNGVEGIYTTNETHFKQFEFLEIINPLKTF
ncbi:MAG: type II toxin-antitoxin system VapC family toxin [bacterium]|nr:type II toxin-antitoxin system VapC family toxin [bacterium]